MHCGSIMTVDGATVPVGSRTPPKRHRDTEAKNFYFTEMSDDLTSHTYPYTT